MTLPALDTVALAAPALLYVVVVLELGRRCVLAHRASMRTASVPGPVLRVLALRPCAGVDECVVENLQKRMPFAQAGELVVVPSRESAAHAAALIATTGAAHARVLAGSVDLANPKVAALAFAVHEAADVDLFLIVDADVDPDSIDAAALVAAFDDPRVGAAWQPVTEVPGETLGDALSSAILLGSFHAFPLLGLLDDGGLVGKVSMVRRAALDAIGGFAAIGNVLGEDMRLAELLREKRYATVMVPGAARSTARRRSVRDVFDRFVRWTLVIKHQRPEQLASYPLFFFPVPLIAIGAWCIHAPWAREILIAVLISRLTLALLGALRGARPQRPFKALLWAPVADLALLLAWLRALPMDRIAWRGNRMRFDADGRLVRLG